jgi:hypothetical protein
MRKASQIAVYYDVLTLHVKRVISLDPPLDTQAEYARRIGRGERMKIVEATQTQELASILRMHGIVPS